MTKKTNEPRRGRPPKYTGQLAKHIVRLVRVNGATEARKILNASVVATEADYTGPAGLREEAAADEREAATKRSSHIVPEPLGISMPTLLKLAKDAKVTLKRGRPSIAA